MASVSYTLKNLLGGGGNNKSQGNNKGQHFAYMAT